MVRPGLNFDSTARGERKNKCKKKILNSSSRHSAGMTNYVRTTPNKYFKRDLKR